MKQLFYSILALFVIINLQAQTVVLSEDFEGTTFSVTSSSTGSSSWGLSSQLQYQGTKSDSCMIALGDTTYLTTDAFSTIGNTFVMLEFAQICKIEFFDRGEIFVSDDNGTTWTKLTASQYLGSGQFGNFTNSFNDASYPVLWDANVNTAPQNSWWKFESFDISSIASNKSQVKVRFALSDANNSGSAGRYGWLLDDIKVTTALSELQPPTITYITPMLIDSVFNFGPYTIQANITDASGVDTALLIYSRNGGVEDTIAMSNGGSLYQGVIDTVPAFSLDDTVCYRIYARDASASVNAISNPTSSCNQFIIKTSPPPPGCTTPITTFPYLQDFESGTAGTGTPASPGALPAGWTRNPATGTGNPYMHLVKTGTTISSSTGPSGDHTTGNGKYVYGEVSSGSTGNTAYTQSPCMDITGLAAPQLEFYYHMYGALIGTLTVQVYYGGNWVDVWTKSGNQGNSWKKAMVNLMPYKSITQIRLKTSSLGCCTGDIAFDDVLIWQPPANDAGVTNLNKPTSPALSGVLPVKVSVRNYGSANLTSATINWQVNGLTQTAFAWSGTLPPLTTMDSIQVGTYAFTAGAPTMKFWTSNPNGLADGFPNNDTLETSIVVCDGYLHGSYTVGTPTSDFANIGSAISALNNCGVDSAVVFNIAASTYTGQLRFLTINGVSATNTITFKGQGLSTIIQANVTSSDRDIIRFNGGKHIILDSLSLSILGSPTEACGIRVRNNSDSNTVRNCNITIPYSTSLYRNGIVFSNSLTSYSSASNSSYWTIENNNITGGYRGISLYASLSNYGYGNKIINNEIEGFHYYGIYSYYQDSILISQNNIHDNKYTYVYGIYSYNNRNGTRIERNRVKLGSTSSSYGIYLSSMNNSAPTADSCIVANNMISLSNSTSTSYGLYLTNANRVKVVFNSVAIYGGSTTSGRGLYQTNGSGLVLSNNIFSNTNGGYAYYINTPSAIDISDYNALYSNGTNLARWGTSNYTSLASLQSSSSKDSNSISVNPMFPSASDLHISSFPLFASGKTVFGISDDIDGDIRASIPCIGADEFTMVADDAGVTSLISPQLTCPGDTAYVIVEVTNYGYDSLISCTINWKVDGILQTPVSLNDTLLNGQTSNVALGTYVFTAGLAHSLEFWTSLPNGNADLQTTNDSLTLPLKTGLTAGIYTVGGTGADFLNFTEVANELNQYGVCGPVIFNVDSGTYNEQIYLANILGLSSINTITIQSTSSDSNDVVLTYNAGAAASNYVVLLDGVDHITIKGITLKSTSSNYSKVLVLKGGLNNLLVSNCVIENTLAYTGTTSNVERDLVYTVDSIGDHINFHYSKFTNGVVALRLVGNTASYGTDWNVLNCDFSENALASVHITYASSALVEKNNFFLTNGIIRSYNGIAFNYCTGSCVASKNTMDIGATSAAHPIRFTRCNGDPLNPHLIVNNFLHYKQLNQSHWGCAINMFNSTYVNVYYNSVSVTGTYSNTAAFQIYDNNAGGYPSGNLVLKNNIFTNSINSTPKSKLFRFNPVNYSYFTNDYNILYSYGVGVVSPQLTNFGAWKTATGGGQHSDTLAPFYTSPTDLHINTNQLNETGVHIPGIIDDIDGDIRDTLLPDIGADEFIPSPYDPSLLAIVSPISGCGLDTNIAVTILVKNYGSAPIYGNLTVGYSWIGLVSPTNITLNDTLLPGDTLSYTFNSTVDLDVSLIGNDSIFEFKAWAKYPGDNFNTNDTLVSNINSNFLPPSPTSSSISGLYGASSTLTATAASLIWWFNSDTATVPVGIGNTFSTPLLYDTTQYWLTSNTNSCASLPTTIFVNMNSFPTVDAGITSIVWPISSIVSNTIQPLEVALYNYGTNNLTTSKIFWSINGQVDSTSWTSPIGLAHGFIDTITVGTTTFNGGVYDFKSWTSMPNSIADTVNTNDTSATVTFNACLSGIYTIGDTTGSAVFDFPSFTSAVNAMSAAGICGPVTFRVDSGVYEERLTFPQISGASDSSRITFTSMTGDSTDVKLHYTTSSIAAWTMKISGQYYTFSHMTLSSNGGSTYGRVMELANGAKYNEILNCVVEGVGTTSSSSNYAVIYSNGGNNEYNTFKNNHILYGSYALYLYGSSTNLQMGNVIEGNKITGFYYYGPYIYYQKNLQFNENYIENGNTTTVYGTRFYYSDNITVTKNTINIHGSSSHYGMYVYSCDGSSSNPNIVANNFVIVNGSGTSTWYGVYCYNSTHTKFYNNSINMTGGSTSARAFYQSSGNNITFINNILSNTGGGYAYYVNTPSAIAASDYNDFYATGANLAYWSGNKANLAALKSASNKDSHSMSSDPMFYTSSDLHSASIDLNNSGMPIAIIVDDIDGEIRDTLNPDIGADEFTPPANDAGITFIKAPLSPVNIGSDNVHVDLRNFGADTLKSATIAWTMNNSPQLSHSWIGSLPTGQSMDSINIGSFNFIGGPNYLKAWPENPNNLTDANPLNDTLMVTLIGCAGPMRGNYSIGGSTADFMSINDALMQMSYCGVDSHVVLNINTGAYNEQLHITQIPGAGDTATVTFQSSTFDSTDVTITYSASSSNNYTVKLNGADWIRFKNVTIEATNTSAGRALVLNNGATNNRFEGNIIKAAPGSTIACAGIYSGGGLDHYNTFRYNRILNGNYGIYMKGVSATSLELGLVFEYNIIEDFYYYGVYLYQTMNAKFNYNTITTGQNASALYSANFYYCDGDLEVAYNKINATPSNYNYALRLYYCDATSANHGKIYNNMINIVGGSGTSYGLYCYYSKYQDIAHNNILVKGSGTSSRALYLYNSTSTVGNHQLLNNSFMMDGPGYAYYVGNSYSLSNSDYNNIYSTSGSFAYYSGAKATLTALQNASGMDSSSISVDPGYYADNNLHVSTVNLNAMATPLTWVTDDFDGQTRNLTTPDIGADEFTPQQWDAAVVVFNSPKGTYAAQGTSQQVYVRIRNFGTDTIKTLNVGYQYGSATPQSQTWIGNLVPGDTASVLFTTNYITNIGTETLTAYTMLALDGDATNDTLNMSFAGLPLIAPTYCDDFDGQNIWATPGTEWQRGIPQGTTINAAHSAPNAWMTRLSGNYSSNANEYLLSPFIDFSNVNNGSTLKFWRNNKFTSSDGFNIEYSDDGGNSWINLGFMGDTLATNWYTGQIGGTHMFMNSSSGWEQSTYNLVQFNQAPNPIQFRFHLISNASGSDEGAAIDDICFELPPIPNDVGVISIDSPVDSTMIGSANTVTITVKNFGTASQTAIPVYYVLNTQTPIAGTLSVPAGLAPDSTAQYTFTQQFNGLGNDYNLCAYTDLTGDVYLSNNETCETIKATAAALDAGVSLIISPDDTSSLGANTVIVRIKNYGSATLSTCDIQYYINAPSNSVTETWTGTPLNQGDSVDFTFTQTYNSPVGYYQVCGLTLLSGDADASNDKTCRTIMLGFDEVVENGMKLWQNIPNPASGNTIIEYEIPSSGKVRFEMVDVLGQSIKVIEEDATAGRHKIDVNADHLAAGIYYYSIEFDGYRLTKKMVVNK